MAPPRSRTEQLNTVIIGIDPGSRITGFGVIELKQAKLHYLDSGCIRLSQENIAERLHDIFTGIGTIMQTYQPHTAAIEQVFMHQNPGAALKLGQARGAAIVAMTCHLNAVAEYSARQVKQAVAGYGAADKRQVQQMVCRLLNLTTIPQADAADALAIAICHAHTRQSLVGLAGVTQTKQGRWR